ncbi:putative ATP-dependent RNA helicase ddx28 [Sorochytrium milnesiophthora]
MNSSLQVLRRGGLGSGVQGPWRRWGADLLHCQHQRRTAYTGESGRYTPRPGSRPPTGIRRQPDRFADEEEDAEDERLRLREVYTVHSDSVWDQGRTRLSRATFERKRAIAQRDERRMLARAVPVKADLHAPMVDLVKSKRPTMPELLYEARIRRPHVQLPVNLAKGKKTWTDLEIHPALIERLEAEGIGNPTEIQLKAIVRAARDENLLILGETGVGKTLAYVLPLVQKLLADPLLPTEAEGPCAVILLPNQVLVQQVIQVIASLNSTPEQTQRLPIFLQPGASLTQLGVKVTKATVSLPSVSAKQGQEALPTLDNDDKDTTADMLAARTASSSLNPSLPVARILVTTPAKLLTDCPLPVLKRALHHVQYIAVDEMDDLLGGASADAVKAIVDKLKERKYEPQQPFAPRIKDPSLLKTTRQFVWVSASIGEQNARWPFEYVKRKFTDLRKVESSTRHRVPNATLEMFVRVDRPRSGQEEQAPVPIPWTIAKREARKEVQRRMVVQAEEADKWPLGSEEVAKQAAAAIKVVQPAPDPRKRQVGTLQVPVVNFRGKPGVHPFKSTVDVDFVTRFAYMSALLEQRLVVKPLHPLQQILDSTAGIRLLLDVDSETLEKFKAIPKGTTGPVDIALVFCKNQQSLDQVFAALAHTYRGVANVLPFSTTQKLDTRWEILAAAREQFKRQPRRPPLAKELKREQKDALAAAKGGTDVQPIHYTPSPLIDPSLPTILVTSGLLERGVDICDSPLVVQFDYPDSAISYLHRAGRTARAGRRGEVVTLYDSSEMLHAYALQLASQGADLSSPAALVLDMLLGRVPPQRGASPPPPLPRDFALSARLVEAVDAWGTFEREQAHKAAKARDIEQSRKETDLARFKKNSEVVAVETWASAPPRLKSDLLPMFDRNGNYHRRLQTVYCTVRAMARDPQVLEDKARLVQCTAAGLQRKEEWRRAKKAAERARKAQEYEEKLQAAAKRRQKLRDQERRRQLGLPLQPVSKPIEI